jgi:hypothetical protein
LLVEPRALHVGLLLRVVLLRVDFAHQVRNLVDSLQLLRAQVSASKDASGLFELGCGLSCLLANLLAEVVSVLSAEVASLVGVRVAGDDGSKALGCGMHRPVNERKLGDVVLVNHPEDGLFLADVDLRVANLLLVRRLQFSLQQRSKGRLATVFLEIEHLRSRRRGSAQRSPA